MFCPDQNRVSAAPAAAALSLCDFSGYRAAAADGVPADTFTSFFERSGICMVRLDRCLTIRDANQEFCRQFERSEAEIRGSSIFGFIHQSGHGLLRQQFTGVLGGDRTRATERVLGLTPEATAFPGQLTTVVVDDGETCATLVLVFEPEAPATPALVPSQTAILTELDARILEGIAAGMSTIRLASKYYLSRQGIEYRVGMMLRRLRVPNRAALVAKAYAMGVLTVGSWPPRVVQDYVER